MVVVLKGPIIRIIFSYSHFHDDDDKFRYRNLRSQSAATGVAGNTALVCVSAWTRVGKRLHTLFFSPNLGRTFEFQLGNANRQTDSAKLGCCLFPEECGRQYEYIYNMHASVFFRGMWDGAKGSV